jgi:hypothetical protein
MHVSGFSKPIIDAYIRANQGDGPLLEDLCSGCKKQFTVNASEAAQQYDQTGEFVPPELCEQCRAEVRTSAVTEGSRRQFVRQFCPDVYDRQAVERYIAANSKQVPMYEDVCDNCKNLFTVQGFTVVNQHRNHGRFTPPPLCAGCFAVYRGKSVAPPPPNATIRRKDSVAPMKIPAVLKGKELVAFRKKWEGMEVLLHFKKHVTFSDLDESGRPQAGRILTFSAEVVFIVAPGHEVHDALPYKLCDVSRIEYKRAYTPEDEPVQWTDTEVKPTSGENDTPAASEKGA